MVDLFQQQSFWIVYKPFLREMGIDAALYFSEVMTKYKYFAERDLLQDGFFYLSTENIEQELTLSPRKQKIIRDKLVKLALLKTTKKGVPPRIYFKPNHEGIAEFSQLCKKRIIKTAKNAQLKLQKTHNQNCKNRHNIYNNNKYNNNKEIITKLFRADVDKSMQITNSQFPLFWQIYPNKGSKGKAVSAWEKVCKLPKNKKPTFREIRIAIRQQKKSEQWQTKKYIPLAASWLNQYRWLDDPAELISYSKNTAGTNKTGVSETKYTTSDKIIL